MIERPWKILKSHWHPVTKWSWLARAQIQQNKLDYTLDTIEGRRGRWMHTSLGGRFWPEDPRADEVYMSDIANGLALDCRYSGQGQVNRYYSVAEHSALMARHALDDYRPWFAYLLLLHDAAEAYVNDLSPATKKALGATYAKLEEGVQAIIWERYNLVELAQRWRREIKEIDMRMVPLEKDAIMRYPQPWAADFLKPLSGITVLCLHPEAAKRFFVATYQEICQRLAIQPEEVEI